MICSSVGLCTFDGTHGVRYEFIITIRNSASNDYLNVSAAITSADYIS
jgi:hypothetical protein